MSTPPSESKGADGTSPRRHPLGVAAAISALAFAVVLAVSAYFDRSIRWLHAFEAIPYIAAAALCWRLSKHGFALGIAAGGLWFSMGAFRTGFVRNGLEQLNHWIHSGLLERPDQLIALPAAASTLALALFSAAAYIRLTRKRWSDLGVLALYVFLVVTFFMAIFAVFAPRYLRVFGIHVGS